MTTLDTNVGRGKPILLRAIFLLFAFKILLSLGLFVGFSYLGFEVGSKGGDEIATIILLTTLGYLATFAAMVVSILNRFMIGLRAAIAVDFVISIPAQAFIGFAIAIIGMGLSFTAPVKAYFVWRQP